MKKTFIILPLVLFFAATAHAQEGLDQVRQFQQAVEQQDASAKKFADYFNQLLQNPRDASVHLTLGKLYAEKNFVDLAIASWRRALSFDPNLIEAHQLLAQLFRKQQRKDLEFLEIQTAVGKAPQNPELLYRFGVLLMEPEHFDYKKAKEQYKILKDLASPRATELAQLLEIKE